MLHRRWKRSLCALFAAFVFAAPVSAAVVEVDGTQLAPDQGWGEDGTSYITLRALAEYGNYELSWDGTQAVLTGEGIELTAVPGACYLEVNGRALYIKEGVGVTEGKTYLPLRTAADAIGGGLFWDGETATAGLILTEAKAPVADYDETKLYWLSRIISAESRGEPMLGQLAVGNVVLNRVLHENYPDNIRDVIFDAKYGIQFEPVANGTIYNDPAHSSILAAKMCLEGAQVVEDCLYFFAPSLSAGTWIVKNGMYHTTIGCHRFYR